MIYRLITQIVKELLDFIFIIALILRKPWRHQKNKIASPFNIIMYCDVQNTQDILVSDSAESYWVLGEKQDTFCEKMIETR